MTIKELKDGTKRAKKVLSKLKRDRERLNNYIVLCEEMINNSTLDNIDDYIQKIDSIEDSFEVIELFIG